MRRNKTLLAVGACAGVAVALYYALRKIPKYFLYNDDEFESGNKTPVSGQSCLIDHSLKMMDTDATPPSHELMDIEATPPSLELMDIVTTRSLLNVTTIDATLSSLVKLPAVCELVDDFTELLKHYEILQTVGSGSCGVVKVGIHILTGEKVAIKIMDKKDVSDPMWCEIDAMMNLHHQHVCQLYQVIETQNLVCLVLEYCAGGELYKLIRKNDGFNEEDARRFFRQIVSALAYVHSKGYAHLDLKPENLLLDEHYNIKLIDFGLCAKPEGGLGSLLTTFTGTPLYTAPELYEQKPYIGSEADVWSLGVVLYFMLCGYLPFVSESYDGLSRQIMKGDFDIADWLSLGSILLLDQMLQVNPKRRVTVEQLLDHQWVMKGYHSPVEWRNSIHLVTIDVDYIAEMAVLLRRSDLSTSQLVSEWKYDHITATYLILLAQKQRMFGV